MTEVAENNGRCVANVFVGHVRQWLSHVVLQLGIALSWHSESVEARPEKDNGRDGGKTENRRGRKQN